MPSVGTKSVGSAVRERARDLLARFRAVRARTVARAAPLSAEDAVAQSMPDASPAKWHLAHTTWFFEEFVLAAAEPAEPRFDERFAFLFNSYYESVGPRHARPLRGLLTRPSLDEVRAYRDAVDARVERWLDRADEHDPARLNVLELGLNHEEQHQELLLTDVLHLFAQSPLEPAYAAEDRGGDAAEPSTRFLRFEEGLHVIGHDPDDGFAFDNEGPRHRVFLTAFELADRPVTQGEYAAFLEDGGYRDPRWWLSDGWAWLQQHGIEAPLYWRRDVERGWTEFTLAGRVALEPSAPVCHLSFYEADAYARFRGARLPTEAEWEVAIRERGARRTEAPRDEPFPARPRATPVVSGRIGGVGEVWEWTASPYVSYPGYRPAAGALGEYNGKFMCDQLVLRGGSCATPPGHARATYRNFFPTDARWQFSGLRLARDVDAASV